jgi:TolB-like protein/DNA-binding winged helix-turn-helix (wHTH) protein/Tfp pilus assembly protein PilF
MDAPSSSGPRIRAGLFEVDLGSGELHKSGRQVQLQEQPFRVLAMLLEHPGEVVTREELQARLWPADTFVSFDEGINTAIRKLRVAFGDSADNPRFIETVPRRGYRFVAPVCDVIAEPAQPSDGIAARSAAKLPKTKHPSVWRWILAASAAALLVVLVTVAYLGRSHAHAKSTAQKRVMLAVLPFQNMSADPAQDYFSDGLTEETITDLGQLSPEHLGVIARTSAMAYKHTNKTITQIGHELDVEYILEGSVRREGGEARVSAQLIRVSDQTNLWAQNYERNLLDLLQIENELGKAIARQVQISLTPQQEMDLSKMRTLNPDAYDLYLKGRFYWNQRTPAGFWKGIESFKQAIEKDPDYAQAYVGLADCYILLGPNDVLPAKEVYPLAKAAALKALQLDDGLAEAHASLGFLMLLYDWNPAQAEKQFQRAIELDPNYPTAHHWYAYDLAAMKRSDEAVAEIRRAVELDPLSSIINTDAGQILLFARRSDEAIAQCHKAIGLDPEFKQAYWYLALLYQEEGLFDQALDAFLKAPPGFPDSQTAAIRSSGISGIKSYWRQRLAMLEQQAKEHYVSPYAFAVTYALMGDRDRSLENLGKAIDERYPSMVFVQIEPVFDSLRSDPRFAALLHRIRAA